MKEYKIFFQPTFHDDIVLYLLVDDDYGIISLNSVLKYERQPFSLVKEISTELIKGFNQLINTINPLFIQTENNCGRDGMNIECSFVDDENNSNKFSIWSPRGNDYREHLVFINSVYNLARHVFTNEKSTRLLENLHGYFERSVAG